MISRMSVVIGLVLAVATMGCGNNSDAGLRGELCELLLSCQEVSSMDDCYKTLDVMVLSDSCMDAMLAATCEEHQRDDWSTTSFASACFNTCTFDGQMCVADQILTCQSGMEMVLDCFAVCKHFSGTAYSGTCGKIGPNGEISEETVCWCEAG